jgi:(R)-2-hydroxyglutarate---pyruvate transhydrogenase
MHYSIAHSGLSAPLGNTYKFNLLIETSGSNTDHDAAKLQNYIEHVLEKEIVSDGVLAESETQLKSLWAIREGVTEGIAHAGGGVYKYDVSVPIELLYDLVEEARKHVKGVKEVIDVVGYGHIGDGNLHLNVVAEKFAPEIEKLLEPWVYEWIRTSLKWLLLILDERKGSISAEHGLGFAKNKYLSYSKSHANIELMRRIKKVFDPKGLMNPYKYLPPLEG